MIFPECSKYVLICHQFYRHAEIIVRKEYLQLRTLIVFDIRVTLNIKIHRIPPFIDNFFAEVQIIFSRYYVLWILKQFFSLFKSLCLRIFIVKKVYFKNYFLYGLALWHVHLLSAQDNALNLHNNYIAKNVLNSM